MPEEQDVKAALEKAKKELAEALIKKRQADKQLASRGIRVVQGTIPDTTFRFRWRARYISSRRAI
jgi:hypothetical protein